MAGINLCVRYKSLRRSCHIPRKVLLFLFHFHKAHRCSYCVESTAWAKAGSYLWVCSGACEEVALCSPIKRQAPAFLLLQVFFLFIWRCFKLDCIYQDLAKGKNKERSFLLISHVPKHVLCLQPLQRDVHSFFLISHFCLPHRSAQVRHRRSWFVSRISLFDTI